MYFDTEKVLDILIGSKQLLDFTIENYSFSEEIVGRVPDKIVSCLYSLLKDYGFWRAPYYSIKDLQEIYNELEKEKQNFLEKFEMEKNK